MTAEKLETYIKQLQRTYEVYCIGFSHAGQPIYVVKVQGRCPKAVVVQAAIHAREHITTSLWVSLLLSLNVKPYATLWVVLQSNPDGVCLTKTLPLYKANIKGVDLNNNFNAHWGKRGGYQHVPCTQGYIGTCAESEPETQALVRFTKKVQPVLTLSYHAKGEEIYFDFFNGMYYNRDKHIARMFAASLQYRIVPTQNVSSGGYKDWCVQTLHIPSLTIEVGSDQWQHPLSEGYLPQIKRRHKHIFLCLKQAVQFLEGNTHDKRRKMDEARTCRSKKSAKKR